jgi:YfiH family protein
MQQASDPQLGIVVQIAGGVALFGDARSAANDLDERELALRAGWAVERLTTRAVPVLYGFQVHGRISFTYSAGDTLGSGAHDVGNCDALITAEPWVALCVRSADCLPIVLAADGVIAIVHAGWKGLASDILGAVVRRMAAELGVASPDLEAIVGVGVGPCHYPVGQEVVTALSAHAVKAEGWASDGRVDLGRWAAGRLLAIGVPQVTVLPGCTACSQHYHSFRRDGERAGRQWNVALLTPGWSRS